MGSQYELPPNGRIRVLSASGTVTVIAEERSDVDVEPANRAVELKESGRHRHRHRHGHGILDHFRKESHSSEGDENPPQRRPVLEAKSKSGNIEVRCPLGTDVSVGAMSGSVKLIGTFGSLKISTVSGNIDIDTARGNVDARCVSGSVRVKSVGGSADVSSKSGRVSIERVEGSVHASTISGGVEIGTVGGQDVELKMVSGGAKVKVLSGKQPRIRFSSLSGKMRCECEQGSDFDLKVKSISGSLEVTGR
jgi:Putative adhesin